MKHVTFADKTLLMGDQVADLLLEYAALLARHHQSDTVDVAAYSADGQAVTAKLLLTNGTPLMAETTHTDLPDPDNREAMRRIHESMARVHSAYVIRPAEPAPDGASQLGDEFDY